MEAIPPIFVAGTGRCGTGQLMKVIGDHPDVLDIPHESRFIVDPGGLEDLTRALTEAYTPYRASGALRAFDHVMRQQVTGRTASTFRGADLPGWVGRKRFWDALNALWPQLVWYEFDEYVPPDGPTGMERGRGPFDPGSSRRVMPRHFTDRSELIAILRGFVTELFQGRAQELGKRVWCEKTPSNLMSLDYLWELFPEATVVHIMRHPVRVVASHLKQHWAPDNAEHVINWLLPQYTRWLRFRESYPLGRRAYVEVKLEDLAVGWSDIRPTLFRSLKLPDHQSQVEGFAREQVFHRDAALTREQLDQVYDRLGFVIEALGYSQSLEPVKGEPSLV